MFDPTVGVWINEDPRGMADDVNLYRYVKNNPKNATDPSGLMHAEFQNEAGGIDKIDPTDKTANLKGIHWKWIWDNNNDLLGVVQRVTVEGTFSMNDDAGSKHEVSWKEQYYEVWYGDRNNPQSDYHQVKPAPMAIYLEKKLGESITMKGNSSLMLVKAGEKACEETEITDWRFQMTAKFEAVNAVYQGLQPVLGKNDFSKNTFSITKLVTNSQTVNNPQPMKGIFESCLYPNKSSVNGAQAGQVINAFPQQIQGKPAVAEDKWDFTWTKGSTNPSLKFTPGDYLEGK